MLKKESADFLVELLSNDSDTLSAISARFASSLDGRDRMVALTGLAMLLCDRLLDHRQQIVAIWLLYCEFQTIHMPDNPFLPVFSFLFDQRLASPNSCSPQLYDILACILVNAPLDQVSENSVRVILGPVFVIRAPDATDVSQVNNYQLRVSPVIVKEEENAANVVSQLQILSALLSDSTVYNDFESSWLRPAPTVAPVFAGELMDTYISSFDIPPPIYDEWLSITSKEVALSLINRASIGKLKKTEIEALSHELQTNPGLVIEANIAPEKVEAMIEASPAIAKELFGILCVREQKLITYLSRTVVSDALAPVLRAVLLNSDLSAEAVGQIITGQIELLHNVRDQQSYLKKIATFCGLLCDVFCQGLRFQDNLLLDLYSFCGETKNESIKESKELAKLLSS
jgi:hypothetical protein